MTDAAPHSTSRPHSPGIHDVPLSVLVRTLVLLLLLTVLTVAASEVDFGAASIWIALIIATTKATLVALYFMHLRYDKPFNAVALICAVLFFILFCSLSLLDSRQYAPNVEEFRAADPNRNYAPELQSR